MAGCFDSLDFQDNSVPKQVDKASALHSSKASAGRSGPSQGLGCEAGGVRVLKTNPASSAKNAPQAQPKGQLATCWKLRGQEDLDCGAPRNLG